MRWTRLSIVALVAAVAGLYALPSADSSSATAVPDPVPSPTVSVSPVSYTTTPPSAPGLASHRHPHCELTLDITTIRTDCGADPLVR